MQKIGNLSVEEVATAIREYWLERGAEIEPHDPFDAPTLPLSVGRLTLVVLPANKEGYFHIFDNHLNSADRDLAAHLSEHFETSTFWAELNWKHHAQSRMQIFGEHHLRNEEITSAHLRDPGEALRVSSMELGLQDPPSLLSEFAEDARFKRGEIAVVAIRAIGTSDDRYYQGASQEKIANYERVQSVSRHLLQALAENAPERAAKHIRQWSESAGQSEDGWAVAGPQSPLQRLAYAIDPAKEDHRDFLVALDEHIPVRQCPTLFGRILAAHVARGTLPSGFLNAASTVGHISEMVRVAASDGTQVVLEGIASSEHATDDHRRWVASVMPDEGWKGAEAHTWVARFEDSFEAVCHEYPQMAADLARAHALMGQEERAIAWIRRAIHLDVDVEALNCPALQTLMKDEAVVRAKVHHLEQRSSRAQCRQAELKLPGPVFKATKTMPFPFLEQSKPNVVIVFLARRAEEGELERVFDGPVEVAEDRRSFRTKTKDVIPSLRELHRDHIQILAAVEWQGNTESPWAKRTEKGYGSLLSALARWGSELTDVDCKTYHSRSVDWALQAWKPIARLFTPERIKTWSDEEREALITLLLRWMGRRAVSDVLLLGLCLRLVPAGDDERVRRLLERTPSAFQSAYDWFKNAKGLDGFAWDPRAKNADLHHALSRFLMEEEALMGRFKDALCPTFDRIKKSDEATRKRFILALIERGVTRTSGLERLVKALLRTKSLTYSMTEIAELLVVVRDQRCSLVRLPMELIEKKILETCAKERPSAEVKALVEMISTKEPWTPRHAGYKTAVLLQAVHGTHEGIAIPNLERGDGKWSDQVLESLEGMQVNAREPWVELLTCAGSYRGTAPSKTWQKRALKCIELVGSQELTGQCALWLSKLEDEQYLSPEQHNYLCGLVWMVSLTDTADALDVIQKVVVGTYKTKQKIAFAGYRALAAQGSAGQNVLATLKHTARTKPAKRCYEKATQLS